MILAAIRGQTDCLSALIRANADPDLQHVVSGVVWVPATITINPKKDETRTDFCFDKGGGTLFGPVDNGLGQVWFPGMRQRQEMNKNKKRK